MAVLCHTSSHSNPNTDYAGIEKEVFKSWCWDLYIEENRIQKDTMEMLKKKKFALLSKSLTTINNLISYNN